VRVLVTVEQLRRTVPGGIGRYASGLLEGLSAGMLGPNESVELLASRPGKGPDPLASTGFGVRASRLPGALLTRGWDHSLVRAPGGFDVVHAVSLAAPPPGRARLVVTVHDMAWRQFPDATTARGRRWHEAGLRRALRRADALVAPSPPVAEALFAAGAKVPVVVLPLGADHLPPPDRSAAEDLLHRIGVTGPFLLSVGTLEPRKNLARLVSGYAQARPALPEPWPLVVVGPPGWGDAGPAHDGSPPGVVTAGPVDDGVLAALYERARLLAYVPLGEGYGIPPVEAMTFGTPVVASRGVPSVQTADGPAALVVDAASTEEIAEGLVVAATDGPRREELSRRGLGLVRTRTWREAAARHLELWRSLR
jgi:glycosyltransferase involved in cell wall biosynthesis